MNQHGNCIIGFLLELLFSCSSEADFTVQELETNHLSKPMGLEENPAFSWQITATEFFSQQAYRILVASTPENLKVGRADFWDSGEIFSDQSLGISYHGKTLESGQKVFWKVLVRNAKDQVQPSDPAWFEMGLTGPDDWQASWIAAINTPDLTPLYYLPLILERW